jgi:hypothetical protein
MAIQGEPVERGLARGGGASYPSGMSKPANLFDDIDEDAEERADLEAEADVAAGRVVPHDEVVTWLESWGKLGELRPPRPKPWK